MVCSSVSTYLHLHKLIKSHLKGWTGVRTGKKIRLLEKDKDLLHTPRKQLCCCISKLNISSLKRSALFTGNALETAKAWYRKTRHRYFQTFFEVFAGEALLHSGNTKPLRRRGGPTVDIQPAELTEQTIRRMSPDQETTYPLKPTHRYNEQTRISGW